MTNFAAGTSATGEDAATGTATINNDTITLTDNNTPVMIAPGDEARYTKRPSSCRPLRLTDTGTFRHIYVMLSATAPVRQVQKSLKIQPNRYNNAGREAQ